MTSLQKESEWELEFDTLMSGYFTIMGHHKSPEKEEIKSFIENLLEQERKDTFKRGYEAGIEDFGTRHRPTTPEKKCCGHKKWTLSKSTKRGTRKICNNCGKDWKNEWETPKLLPTSSYEVTCGRCEKSIKHSC